LPNVRASRGRLQFSLRAILLVFIPMALLAGLAKWLLYPPPLEVSIWAEQASLCRYDDGAGNLPLAAVVKITNSSESTAWFLGYGSPVQACQQLVDGEWDSRLSWVNSADPPPPKHWTPLRTMESITILAGPISEKAAEFRVGVPFTTERLAPTKVHWVFSPAFKIIKRGQDYFPESTQEAQQEDQVLSRTWPKVPSESRSGSHQ
jgi:hypothetical protein